MAHVIPQLAEAIKDAINAASLDGSLGCTVTAIRRWLPLIDREELNGTVILVVARGAETAPATRGKDFETVQIDVVLFREVGAQDTVQIDAMFDLIQKIHGVLRRPFETPNGGWQGRSSEPIFDVESLNEKLVLKSRTTYTYLVYHDVRIPA